MVQVKRQRRVEMVSLLMAFLALTAITIVYMDDRAASSAHTRSIERSRGILEAAERVIADLRDGEAGQRGFLLTGREHYLQPYIRASRILQSDVRVLRAQTAGEPIAGEATALAELAERKFAEMAQTIELRRGGDVDGALRIILTDRGKLSMDAARQLAARISSTEYAHLSATAQAGEARAWRTRFLTTASLATMFVLLGLAMWTIYHGINRRERLITSLGEQRERTTRARDLLQTTLASIGDGVIVCGADGRITFVNAVAETLTGWRRAEANGRAVEEVFRLRDEQGGILENPATRALREGVVVTVRGHAMLTDRFGRSIPIDDSAAPIRTAGGSSAGAVLVFRDITERRHAERERERLLKEAEAARADTERERAHLHSLFEQAPATINVYRGPDHILDFAHPAFSEMAGRDLTGVSLWEAFPELRHQPLGEQLDRVYRDGIPASLTETVMRIEARGQVHEFFVNVFLTPWRDAGGKVAGVMAVSVNVTGQVQARAELTRTQEKLRETAKLESLGVLAGGVAHDFNNLLTGIMGNAGLAADMLGDHPASALLGEVISASERAADLTRQMLAYSGQGRFFMQPVDLSASVREITALVHSSIPRNVTVKLELASELGTVLADLGQMQQLVMNLVINAAESYGGRPGLVTVRTSAESITTEVPPDLVAGTLGPGDYVRLDVSDLGCGMDEETRNRVFEPFFTTKFTGRGLGLSAVLGIVRGHSGAIRLQTATGSGTTFSTWFPVSAEVIASPVAEAVPADRNSGTILLADDEDTVRQMAAMALRRTGYEVVTAVNGEQAIEYLRNPSNPASLLVLDLTMPVMSGLETLEALRSIRPQLPVLLCSGYEESTAMKDLEPDGIAAFLQKPYTASRLARKVREALNGSGTG